MEEAEIVAVEEEEEDSAPAVEEIAVAEVIKEAGAGNQLPRVHHHTL